MGNKDLLFVVFLGLAFLVLTGNLVENVRAVKPAGMPASLGTAALPAPTPAASPGQTEKLLREWEQKGLKTYPARHWKNWEPST